MVSNVFKSTPLGRLLAGSVALVLVLIVAAAPQGHDIADLVDQYIAAHIKQGTFSGAVLLARDGKILVSKGYEMANYEHDIPNTAETKFRLGSITKQFTAAAILQLQEKGLLSVDDPITKYFPDYKTAAGVTIHHLLAHTSGIPNFTSFPDYQKTMAMNSPIEKTIERFKDRPLEFTPGEKFSYSNSGYVLLGAIIEKVSGKTYREYLTANILEPLGMKNTGYDLASTLLKHRASGYSRAGRELTNAAFLDMSIPHAAGAMYSTVEDLYLWDRALYTENVVRKSSLGKMFTPFKRNYGYGWVIDQHNGRKRISHGGGINGFATQIYRYPEHDVCIVVLTNVVPSQAGNIARDLAAIAFGDKYELPRERVAMKLDPKIYDAYTGRYRTEQGMNITITREGDSLMGQPEGQGKLELFPESETTFFLKAIEAQVVFVKDDNGQVTHFILKQGGRDQVAKKMVD